jgi:hypothetical protein
VKVTAEALLSDTATLNAFANMRSARGSTDKEEDEFHRSRTQQQTSRSAKSTAEPRTGETMTPLELLSDVSSLTSRSPVSNHYDVSQQESSLLSSYNEEQEADDNDDEEEEEDRQLMMTDDEPPSPDRHDPASGLHGDRTDTRTSACDRESQKSVAFEPSLLDATQMRYLTRLALETVQRCQRHAERARERSNDLIDAAGVLLDQAKNERGASRRSQERRLQLKRTAQLLVAIADSEDLLTNDTLHRAHRTIRALRGLEKVQPEDRRKKTKPTATTTSCTSNDRRRRSGRRRRSSSSSSRRRRTDEEDALEGTIRRLRSTTHTHGPAAPDDDEPQLNILLSDYVSKSHP